MVTYAKLRTEALVFEPLTTAAPDNALYANTSGGEVISIGGSVPVASSDTSLFSKQMQAGVANLPINIPVSKRPDGKIVPLDRDDPNAEHPIGVTTTAGVSINDLVSVFLSGPNLPGVLTGKGFAPGDIIYSDNIPGGMVNSIVGFNPATESILRLGVADCAPGIASSQATDLILSMATISLPTGI